MTDITFTPACNPFNPTLAYWSYEEGFLAGTVAQNAQGWLALVDGWTNCDGRGDTPRAAVRAAVEGWEARR